MALPNSASVINVLINSAVPSGWEWAINKEEEVVIFYIPASLGRPPYLHKERLRVTKRIDTVNYISCLVGWLKTCDEEAVLVPKA